MSQQATSRSIWPQVSSSRDFPTFIKWLETEEIPDLEQQLLNLDALDKNLRKDYIRLKGGVESLTAIIVKYNTRDKGDKE